MFNDVCRWLEATGFTYLALSVKSVDLDLALVSMIPSLVMTKLCVLSLFTIYVVMNYYSLVCSMLNVYMM